jgi:hypothetical protein
VEPPEPSPIDVLVTDGMPPSNQATANRVMTEPSAEKPSALFATMFVVAALAYAAYLSPHHWSAAGIACLTGSALIAAPELIEHLVRGVAHPRVQRTARAVARGVRLLTLVVYALALLVVLLVAAGSPSQAASVAVFFLITFGFVEVIARQTRSILRDVASNGAVDARFYERFGSAARWTIAGGLFFSGTLIQLIGTFVE